MRNVKLLQRGSTALAVISTASLYPVAAFAAG
jgi:hypothetical protein